MDRSLRPFSLTWLALALVIWAGLEAAGGAPAPLPAPAAPAREVQRIEFRITGDVLGPGMHWHDLGRGDIVHDEHGEVRGLRLHSLVDAAARVGLREGDLVVAIDGVPVDASNPSRPRVMPRGGRRWCLSVLRDEAPLELCYELLERPRRARAPGHDHSGRGRSELRRSALARQPLADALLGSNGDLLLSVDEIALDSTDGLARAWDAVRTRTSICVRALCRATPFERCFDLVP